MIANYNTSLALLLMLGLGMSKNKKVFLKVDSVREGVKEREMETENNKRIMTNETFKPIKGYEGFYSIGDKGTVKGLNRKVRHKTGLITIKEKIIQPWINKRGYVLIRLSKNGVTKTHYVHVLNMDANFPKVSGKQQVNHIDCNKSNNELSNLERVSSSENMLHAYRNGLIKKGTKVIDLCSNKTYHSIKEAARDIQQSYTSCIKMLLGRKTNTTCLKAA